VEVLCCRGWEDKEVSLDVAGGHVGGLSVEFPTAELEAHIVGLCHSRDLMQNGVNFEEPETIPECSLKGLMRTEDDDLLHCSFISHGESRIVNRQAI
jgi:hypothetical protein